MIGFQIFIPYTIQFPASSTQPSYCILSLRPRSQLVRCVLSSTLLRPPPSTLMECILMHPSLLVSDWILSCLNLAIYIYIYPPPSGWIYQKGTLAILSWKMQIEFVPVVQEVWEGPILIQHPGTFPCASPPSSVCWSWCASNSQYCCSSSSYHMETWPHIVKKGISSQVSLV